MYIADNFIYLHIPKTGGQSMNKIIHMGMKNYGNRYVRKMERYHKSIQDIDPQYLENRKIYAVVRNPWRWYVCWYHFIKNMKDRGAIFNTISNDGKYGFKRTINNLFDMIDGNEELTIKYGELKLIEDEKRLKFRTEQKRVAKDKIPSRMNFDINPLESTDDLLSRTNQWDRCGLQSYYYHWLVFGEGPIEDHDYTNVTIGKQESSRDDFIAFLEDEVGLDFETEIGSDIKESIINNERVNITKDYGDYKTYYDEELIERVSEKESYIINKYGYLFDDNLASI